MDADPSVISFNVIFGVLLVDILLSGDNAIVIALVCRSLPKRQQTRVMWLGILGALLARLLLTSVATLAMQLPLIKLVGGLLLLKISVGLIVDNIDPKEPVADGALEPESNVYAAAKTIILADIVMSLDNVLALSAVTQNNFQMLVLGLLLSIPILMFGSLYIAKLLDMFPVFLWVGAGILGGVAGGLLIDDPVFGGIFSSESSMSHFVIPALAAAMVIEISRTILRNRAVLQGVPQPLSLVQIFRGAQHVEVAAPRAVPSSVAAQLPVPDLVLVRPDPQPVSPAAPSANPDPASPLPSPSSGAPALTAKSPGDYRVVAAIVVFVLLVGWAIYALVSAEPPPVPDRLVAFKCKEPALVIHYRASARQVRLASAKGAVDARLQDDRIVWDDYAAASKTLGLKPPLKMVALQAEQMELQGGDFERSVCALSGH